MTDLSIQPWSAVWRIPTTDGNVLMKQTVPARANEGAVHAFCAEFAPDHVDPPLAFDDSSGRILFADGGPTMDEASKSTPDHVVAMVSHYADLQKLTVDHHDGAKRAGLPDWDPAEAGQEIERQTAILHALPSSDLRKVTAAQRDQLLVNVDTFEASGAALATSSIPYCIEHGDLWLGNVLIGPGESEHYRFIDFGDAAWTHPFLSVMPLLFECHRRWSPGPASPFDPTHPALRSITDTYLRHWSDYASRRVLTDTFEHAIRIAPLRRSRAAITNISHATPEVVHDLGPTPWAWLETAVMSPTST